MHLIVRVLEGRMPAELAFRLRIPSEPRGALPGAAPGSLDVRYGGLSAQAESARTVDFQITLQRRSTPDGSSRERQSLRVKSCSSRANVFCSSLNNGHQDHNLVPIGRLVAFDHRSGSFGFFEAGILACE